jgi:phage terminase small subunit
MTRDEIVEALLDRGSTTRRDRACQYADVFLEYQEASANIAMNGVVVTHPRTGAPMMNPYMAVRDNALKKLQTMKTIEASFLWEGTG